MNTLSFTTLLTHSLAWALLYSLWQGLLTWAMLFVLLKALGTVSSRVKYYLSVGTFGLLFVWFADTWLSQYQKLKGITVYITQGGGSVSPLVTHQASTAVPDTINYNVLKSTLMGLERYSSLIITLYCIGLGLMLVRFALNLWQVKVLRNSGVAAPQAHLVELVEHWQEQFNISTPVKLLLSSQVSVPMILGILKPVILLPVATINHLSIDQLEAILMHELAHIKRQDYLLNIVQTIAETILFFNPFVWLISATIRKERENCCDDMVVAHTIDPLPYAHALAILETNRTTGHLSLAATGKNKHQLFNRIKRIMEMKKQNINYSQLGIIVMAAIAIVCSVALFTPSFAQKAKTKKSKSDSTSTKVYTKTYTMTGYGTDSTGKSHIYMRMDSTKQKPFSLIRDVQVSMNDDKDVDSATEVWEKVFKGVVVNDIVDDVMSDNKYGPNGTVVITTDVDTKKVADDVERTMRKMKKEFPDMDEIDKGFDEVMAELNDPNFLRDVKMEIKRGLAEADKQLNDPQLKREIKMEVKRGLEEARRGIEEGKRVVREAQRDIATARADRETARADRATARADSRTARADRATAIADMETAKRDMAEAKRDMHRNVAISISRDDNEESPAGTERYEEMLGKLEHDGLINRSKGFKIVKKNGKLIIDGRRMPDALYDRYSTYLKGERVEISGTRETLSISVRD